MFQNKVLLVIYQAYLIFFKNKICNCKYQNKFYLTFINNKLNFKSINFVLDSIFR